MTEPQFQISQMVAALAYVDGEIKAVYPQTQITAVAADYCPHCRCDYQYLTASDCRWFCEPMLRPILPDEYTTTNEQEERELTHDSQ